MSTNAIFKAMQPYVDVLFIETAKEEEEYWREEDPSVLKHMRMEKIEMAERRRLIAIKHANRRGIYMLFSNF